MAELNVLIIMADELSCFGLGCYGSDIAQTPNIDAFAERGMRFDAAYTPSPMCVPARAAFATGRYVHEIGCWDSAHPYDGSHPSWGHRLLEAGREVVSIGKLHYRSAGDPNGFGREIEPIHVPGGIGWTIGLLRDNPPPFRATTEMARMLGEGESSYTAFDRRVADAAVDWLATPERRRGARWTVFVSFLCPHYPLIAPSDFYRLYDPASLESEAEEPPDHPVVRELARFFDYDRHFTRQARGIGRAAYYGLCSFLDSNVGAVLGALERSGQADDTLVLFTADHGEMLGHKGFWGKSTMYEECARVPLLMAGPGVASGTRAAPVDLVDLAPTILEAGLANADVAGLSGRSLLRPPEEDGVAFSEYHDGGCSAGFYMVRWNHWKYVHYAGGHPCELFDVENDPSEQTNLAADPRHDCVRADGLRRLTAILDPEETNARARQDQGELIKRLGGSEAVLTSGGDFGFTSVDSR